MSLTLPKSSKRHVIDWQQLPLPAAAEWLAEQHLQDAELDMSGIVIVVPSARSQRRLLELLIEQAEQHELIFTPPMLTTIGSFPELVYKPQVPLAGNLTQKLAWVEALRTTPEKQLKHFAGKLPDKDDSPGWQILANVIAKWHVELAGNGLNFKDVLKAGQKNDFFPERERWETLHSIQRSYLDILNREKLWDRQTARLVALAYNECKIDKHVYLVGTVDLNPTFRKMLGQISASVTSVIFAKPEDLDKFDEFGCLDIETWEATVIEIDDDDIVIADQPGDQAKLLTRFIHDLDGEFGVDQISISVPDQSIRSNISRSLIQSGVNTHDSGGSSIGNTRTFVLLELLAAWLGDERFESFAALVRHPDMYEWLTQRVGTDQWLFELDNYQNNRLPFYISTDINKVYFGGKDRKGRDIYAHLEKVYHELFELVQPLISKKGKPLSSWGGPWRQVLVAVYRDTTLNRELPEDRRTIRACQKIVQALIEVDECGHLLDGNISSVDAMQWALELCSDEFVADPAVPNAISMIGWLDTALEDTPVTIITSLNDGFVPSSENSSLFLPNSIRTLLGLVDNRRRYARDAYALRLITASRKRLLCCVGRRDAVGQPLLPSRLLMTGDTTRIANRAIRLFGDGVNTSSWVFGLHKNRPTNQQFAIPDPGQMHPHQDSMRVTDFGQYLSCPYRYFLSRVLRIERLTDKQDELDAAQFGSLLHDVVENFGRSDIKNTTSEKDIEAYLLDCLDRYSLARYGRRAVPTVQIQLEQARTRMVAFAKWQANHRNAGYEIFEVERERTRCEFNIDGTPFEVRGQIDRIDINHDQQLIGLYDYKTGDKAVDPTGMHQDRNGNWTNLQLPLYHHLLEDFDLPKNYKIETGLISISKDTSKIGLYRANWSDAALKSADETAMHIMRQVRLGVFGPPKEMNKWWDDYAGICQSKVFERWTDENEVTP